MARRNETIFASLALLLLFALSILPGCRAFDPEPVIVNLPPDTFLIGAPAETTGARFRRHMYWYGSDEDGEVVRYIYAITDSTVRDTDIPDVDEEDDRFNPALFVTTLETVPGRFVGWTAKTDSIFEFDVDREETPAKDITFHIVAIDDRGAIDPTPARLYFFNNSLGNPVVRFSVYVDEGPGGASAPDWRLRWVGTPSGPNAALSPEDSDRPYVGFGRRFRVEWDGSSPNGSILGYRFKAEQGSGAFTPPDIGDEKQWNPDLRSFTYRNDVAPTSIAGCDTFTAVGCGADSVRFNSGNYSLIVKAIDEILVESEAAAGELLFEVNYPPDTRAIDDDTYPLYRILDQQGNIVSSTPFSAGDTIPDGAYVVTQATGFDRLVGSAQADPDSFCCDEVLNPDVPEVRFQTRLELQAIDGQRTRRFLNTYSRPDVADTIGFLTGPFDFQVETRAVDEHRRPDPTPSPLNFRAGFDPIITSISPTTGDTLLLRQPGVGGAWPENDIPYTTTTATRYWDQIQYFDEPAEGRTEVAGQWFEFRPRFVGTPDPREAGTRVAIKAWAYAMFSERDPLNEISDGPGESPDFSFFNTSPNPNEWAFTEPDEVFRIFVPGFLWLFPSAFEPGSGSVEFEAIGRDLRRYLGEITLRVVGRTTEPGNEYDLYVNTRPGPNATVQTTIQIERMGRLSQVSEQTFHILLGLGSPAPNTVVDRYWPDFDD